MTINILKRANTEFEYNKHEYSKLATIANACPGNWQSFYINLYKIAEYNELSHIYGLNKVILRPLLATF